jgi:acetolactate synthase-1/2/3 large subunit
VAYVTAGPGALNTLTGVVGAYVDSAPCIIVAGQSKVSQATVTGPRQFALQGFNTLPLFQQVTKYAVMLKDLSRVRYEVEKSIHIARSGRFGPVWIECPIDVQGAPFDPAKAEGFNPQKNAPTEWGGYNCSHGTPLPCSDSIIELIQRAADAIRQSKRPCLLAGAGIRAANAVDLLHDFINRTGIPVMTSRLGMDLIDDADPFYAGRPGTYGERSANFAVQNCDLLLVIGCRLGIGLVGHDYAGFAPQAKIIMVDVDEHELAKPSVVPDLPINMDAGIFLRQCLEQLRNYKLANKKWIEQIQLWRKKYPVDLPEYAQEKEGINSYHFTGILSQKMPADSIIVVDTGSCFHVHAQAFKVKKGQRHIITGGLSTMGFMPGVIGAAAVDRQRDVYCITGDGSLQMNIQELVTIAHNKLRAKLIVNNNLGYLLIRLTQNNFQEGRHIGIDEKTGLGLPDLKKIAAAYGIHYIRIASLAECDEKLKELFDYPGAVICDVLTPPEQLLIPRVSSKKMPDGSMVSMPYDDMYPFLPRSEYEREKSVVSSQKSE